MLSRLVKLPRLLTNEWKPPGQRSGKGRAASGEGTYSFIEAGYRPPRPPTSRMPFNVTDAVNLQGAGGAHCACELVGERNAHKGTRAVRNVEEELVVGVALDELQPCRVRVAAVLSTDRVVHRRWPTALCTWDTSRRCSHGLKIGMWRSSAVLNARAWGVSITRYSEYSAPRSQLASWSCAPSRHGSPGPCPCPSCPSPCPCPCPCPCPSCGSIARRPLAC